MSVPARRNIVADADFIRINVIADADRSKALQAVCKRQLAAETELITIRILKIGRASCRERV